MKNLLLILFSMLFMASCSNEYQVVHQDPTVVIVDSLQQPEQVDTLDILVVLDTSGSMWDDARAVGIGMEVLSQDIQGMIPDYQFGFLSADPFVNSFMGPYIDPIKILIAPELLHGNSEQGFLAAYMFLTEENTFLREEADLLVFFISDEDEQSGLTASTTADWLTALKPGRQVDVISIVATVPECGLVGSKYMEISNIFGKDAIDLCAESWESWLAEASFLLGLQEYVNLTYSPIPGSIVVYVNNKTTIEWSYNEDLNRVDLEFEQIHGSLVEVGYKTLAD